MPENYSLIWVMKPIMHGIERTIASFHISLHQWYTRSMEIIKKNHILPYLTPYLPENPIIVEAGAFDGTDTRKMSAHWPNGTIHAFEPVPDIFALLEKNTQNLANVVRHPIALSDHIGSATLYVSEKPNKPGEPFQAGTLLKPKERLKHSPITYPRTITVPTTT